MLARAGIVSYLITVIAAIPVVYRHTGVLYATTDNYELSFNVDLRSYHEHCKMLKQQINIPHHSNAAIACHTGNRRLMERQCDTVDGWAITYFQGTRREKRQAMMVATVLGALGMTALIEMGGLVHLNSRVDKNARELERLRQQMQDGQKHQKQVNGILSQEINCHYIRLALIESETIIAQTTENLERLTGNRRISTSLLPVIELNRLWPQITREIRNMTGGQASFPFPQHAVYETPASYTWDGRNLRVYLHLPLVREELQLYRRNHFPLIHHDNTTPMHPTNVKPFMATNKEGTSHLVLNGDDLAACTTIQQAKFCQVGLMFRTFSSTCEGALFEGRPSMITKRCELAPFKDKWAVTQTGHRDYTLYINDYQEAMRTCDDGTRQVLHIGKGLNNISVPEGCTFTTGDFVLPEQHEYQSTLHVVNHVQFADVDTASFLVLPGAERSGEEDMEEEAHVHVDATWFYAAASFAIACTLANAGIFCILIWRFRARLRGLHKRTKTRDSDRGPDDHEMEEMP